MNDVMVDAGLGSPVIVTGEVIKKVKSLPQWREFDVKDVATLVSRKLIKETKAGTPEDDFPKDTILRLTPPHGASKSIRKPYVIPLCLSWSLNGVIVNLKTNGAQA